MSPPPRAGDDKGAPVRFSIVMNVYNGEDFLREAIDSVIAQTFADWELILWDDASTDGSAAICAEYASPKVRYVRSPERVPLAEARNRAIRCTTGQWVAFLDQDDIWAPDKLAAQDALIRQDAGGSLGLVYGRALRFDAHGRQAYFDSWYGPNRLPEGDIFADLLDHPSFIAMSTLAIEREVLLEVTPIPPEVVYCPDYYLCLQAAKRHRSACVQAQSCLYRVHGASMSSLYRKEIHAEILRIVETLAGAAQSRIVRRRQLVHETWIGFEEIRGGQAPWSGVARIFSRGSFLYLTLRPLLLLARRMRHRIAPAKYALIGLIRSLGLLQAADWVKFTQKLWAVRARNKAFVRAHPDFAVPPADLAFDAYNHVDWPEYHDGGLRHAGVFADIIRREAEPGPLTVLEWGCGPARIIRHLAALMPDRTLQLVGSDYNPRSINWCRAHVPGVRFVLNGLRPPLDLPDASVDVVYNFSVFTHLSETVQRTWADELLRVLRPGGLMICSTHGDHYRYLLTSREEIARYQAGEVVTQEGYGEGKKWYFAVHPPAFVKEQLLGRFEGVGTVPVSADANLKQDIWIARKPQDLLAPVPLTSQAHG